MSDTGSTLLCRTLERLGVECVFGLPGSQDILLFETLRRSRLRTVLTTHELAAAFMANGYARASGKVGVLITIAGPGFTYALPGLAEALLDSAPLLHIVHKPAASEEHKFALQALDQEAIARPLVKAVYEVDDVGALVPILEKAYATALGGEPGPVLLQVADTVFSQPYSGPEPAAPSTPLLPVSSASELEETVRRLAASRRALIYCGQGVNDAAPALRQFSELLQAPVVATRSARGVLPEDHPLAIVFNPEGGAVVALNRLVVRSDLVLALGCKFSFNGSAGFQLRIPPEKLLHVDASPDVLGSNYASVLAICSGVSQFLASLLQDRDAFQSRVHGWDSAELARWREEIWTETAQALTEPKVKGLSPPTPAGFFSTLRKIMPAESCLVTDSGLHQLLARVHFCVTSPRGLLVPSDFQSMGFGLPAAIGAQLAAPHRPVVALIGDGGMAISAMELLTAVREGIPLTVIVFNDGALGQIRLQQLSSFGIDHATHLLNPDFALLAESLGVTYFLLEGDAEDVLRRALGTPGVSLIEVRLGDSPAIHLRRAHGAARETARRLLPTRVLQAIKRRLGLSRH
jgi:acetolactate synthase-1/2/3 large subunit